ncbi:MAG: family 1 glycosylhydrolase [Armatimonadetes bacterium]|nr:family 1 glycosylhydrolase [Armatimonadota bacterium]
MFKAVGIEGGSPITRRGRVDEYAKTHHYESLTEDADAIVALKCTHVRYVIPWHRVERSPGVYDWEWVDEALGSLRVRGLRPIPDLCHFGGPDWLEERGGPLAPDFADRFAAYATAFATRYPWVRELTLINEPFVYAKMAGREGAWNPFRGDAFLPIARGLAEAIRRGAAAVRRAAPHVRLWQTETCDRHHAADPEDPEIRRHVARQNRERFLLFTWTRGCYDVVGLDYYPWCEVTWERNGMGFRTAKQARRAGERPNGLAELIAAYHRASGCPVFIAETDTAASIEHRILWLGWTVGEAYRARAMGIPVLGYTWWPLYDNLNWAGHKPVDTPDNAGVLDLERVNGRWERRPTALAHLYGALDLGVK